MEAVAASAIHEREARAGFDEPLPFRAGESPFRCKGLAMSYSLRRLIDDYGDAFFDALPSDDSRAFFRQPILASGWYDAFPLVHLVAAAGRLMGGGPQTALRALTRAHTENDLTRVHRMLLKVASPSAILSRVGRLNSQYWKFGGISIEATRDGSAQMVRTGLPARMHAYGELSTVEYLSVVLQATGWRTSVVAHPWRPAGLAHGIPVVDIPLELAWSKS